MNQTPHSLGFFAAFISGAAYFHVMCAEGAMVRKIKWPKIGQYVLVTKWSDKDPCDPSYVGYIESIPIYDKSVSYRVKGSNRNWGYCHRITPEEGEEWLRRYGD